LGHGSTGPLHENQRRHAWTGCRFALNLSYFTAVNDSHRRFGSKGSLPEDNVLVTGAYQNTAVFDAITLHSAGHLDILHAELNVNPDHDDCKGSRCNDHDDDNSTNHGAEDK
jgi:hypothetical protein